MVGTSFMTFHWGTWSPGQDAHSLRGGMLRYQEDIKFSQFKTQEDFSCRASCARRKRGGRKKGVWILEIEKCVSW